MMMMMMMNTTWNHSDANISLGSGPDDGAPFFSVFDPDLSGLLTYCHTRVGVVGWLTFKIFILLTVLPANAGLMWMLARRRSSMTPSELLGLNVSIVDILFCLSLPLDIYTALHRSVRGIYAVTESLFVLNVFGCPLLLTCMCLERYLAVAWPFVYRHLGRRGYRLALCACAWVLTLAVALLGFFCTAFVRTLYQSVTISLLFLAMLLCLLGIVGVLRRSGPGDSSGTTVPRRKALRNISAVLLQSVVAYSPVVGLVPLLTVILTEGGDTSRSQCFVLQLLLLFPNFGLFIAPMFYLSQIRRRICWNKDQKPPTSRTQEAQTRVTQTRNIKSSISLG